MYLRLEAITKNWVDLRLQIEVAGRVVKSFWTIHNITQDMKEICMQIVIKLIT